MDKSSEVQTPAQPITYDDQVEAVTKVAKARETPSDLIPALSVLKNNDCIAQMSFERRNEVMEHLKAIERDLEPSLGRRIIDTIFRRTNRLSEQDAGGKAEIRAAVGELRKAITTHEFSNWKNDVATAWSLKEKDSYDGYDRKAFVVFSSRINLLGDTKAKRQAGFEDAIRFGQVNVVKLFLLRGDVDLNHRNKDGYTPLILAARANDPKVLELLLQDARVKPNQTDREGYTALMHAVREAKPDNVALLIANERVDVNKVYKGPGEYEHPFGVSNQTDALQIAVRERGQTYADPQQRQEYLNILTMLQNCVRIQLYRRGGQTALMDAARLGDTEAAGVLLSTAYGNDRAHVNHQDSQGRTAIVLAAWAPQGKRTEIAKTLLLSHPDTSLGEYQRGALWWASAPAGEGYGKNLPLVTELLKQRGVSPSAPDRFGHTPLMNAVQVGDSGMVSAMIIKLKELNPSTEEHPDRNLAQWNADFNRRDNEGNTVFDYAVMGGQRAIFIELLTALNLKPTLKPENAETVSTWALTDEHSMLLAPLDFPKKKSGRQADFEKAIRDDDIDIVKKYLLHGNIDLNHRNDKGETPLIVAAVMGKTRALDLLLQDKRVDPNWERDPDFFTPLMRAIKAKQLGSVKCLLQSGRMQNIKQTTIVDSWGVYKYEPQGSWLLNEKTALQIAVREYAAATGEARGLLGQILEEMVKYEGLDVHSALRDAVVLGDVDAVRLLLQHRADPDDKDSRGSARELIQKAPQDKRDAIIAAMPPRS